MNHVFFFVSLSLITYLYSTLELDKCRAKLRSNYLSLKQAKNDWQAIGLNIRLSQSANVFALARRNRKRKYQYGKKWREPPLHHRRPHLNLWITLRLSEFI